MKGIRSIAAAGLLLLGALAAAHAQPITFSVDCTEGQKVADALSRGDFKKPLVIVVRGTCNESITIVRDDVTLKGDAAVGGELHGPSQSVDTIVVSGDRVTLSQLAVTGGAVGVRLQGAYNLTLDLVNVRDTHSHGVQVRSGALEFTNSTIEHAGGRGLILTRGAAARLQTVQVLENTAMGLSVDAASSATVSSSTIRSNGGAGAQFDSGAHGVFMGTEISWNGTDANQLGSGIIATGAHVVVNANNVIEHNREHGILAQAAATLSASQSTIANNGRTGVFGYLGSNLVLQKGTISGNGEYGVYCRAHCTAQIGGATIESNGVDGIGIMLGSVLIFEEPATVSSGNTGWGLWCGDGESSVDRLDLFGDSTSGCTGF